MFGVQERILQIYHGLKGEPAFLYSFNLKVRIVIRTVADTNKLDSARTLQELKLIAEEAKRRNFSTKQYLQVVIKYVNDAAEGYHKLMRLDPETLELKPNCKDLSSHRSYH